MMMMMMMTMMMMMMMMMMIIIIIIIIHYGIAKVIRQKLAEAAELIADKSPYYRHTPANVLENDNFKLYWNGSIITDKTIPANRPNSHE